MIGLVSLRDGGFQIRLLSNSGIGVTPVEELTSTQREWVKSNIISIRECLLIERRRWEGFLSLASEFDVTEIEVKAEFTCFDITDLVMPVNNDESLVAFMGTLANYIKLNRRHAPAITRLPLNVEEVHGVQNRCGRCKHFVPNSLELINGLGFCEGRSDLSTVVPSRAVECAHYQERYQSVTPNEVDV